MNPLFHSLRACSVAQSCLTLCDPMNCSPPGSSVHGISQARILESVAISSSRQSSWPRNQTCVSCIGRQINKSFKGIYLAVLGLSCGFTVEGGLFFTSDMGTLSCGVWDLVPWPGIECVPPTLGVRSLSHWPIREVPGSEILTGDLSESIYRNFSQSLKLCSNSLRLKPLLVDTYVVPRLRF